MWERMLEKWKLERDHRASPISGLMQDDAEESMIFNVRTLAAARMFGKSCIATYVHQVLPQSLIICSFAINSQKH